MALIWKIMPNFMNKKAIVGGIVLAMIGISIVYGTQINPDNPENEKRVDGEVWNMRISGVEFHDLPVFGSEIGVLGIGTYELGFVPMGDSPEYLSIRITEKNGDQVFHEDFTLQRTLIDTGISQYYTWEYLGEKFIPISEKGEYDITIKREGNLKGSVSISLSKLDRSI